MVEIDREMIQNFINQKLENGRLDHKRWIICNNSKRTLSQHKGYAAICKNARL